MSTMECFFDESGNSGDIGTLKFLESNPQLFFTLACIKTSKKDIISDLVVELKKKHSIDGELKSSKLRNKFNFLDELITLLLDNECEIFVELVDKKFQLCSILVMYYIFSPHLTKVESENFSKFNLLNQHITSFVHQNISNDMLIDFIKTYTEDDVKNIENTISNMQHLLQSSNIPEELKGLSEYVEDIKDIYDEFSNQDDKKEVLKLFRQPPDIVNGKVYNILPNITCFTNILARINKSGYISDFIFTHDTQSEYASALESIKLEMSNLSQPKSLVTPYADFRIPQNIRTINFENSHDNIMIQCCDIVAGIAIRYVQDIMKGKKTNEKLRLTLCKINGNINYVTSIELKKKCERELSSAIMHSCIL